MGALYAGKALIFAMDTRSLPSAPPENRPFGRRMASVPPDTPVSLGCSGKDNHPEDRNRPVIGPDRIEWLKCTGTARCVSCHDFGIAGRDGAAEDPAFSVRHKPGGERTSRTGGYE